jgi:ribosome-associated protein
MSTSPNAADQIIGAELACACSRFADEKQAADITILDLRGLSQLCDFFVICTAGSEPHIKAIRQHALKGLADDHAVKANHRDGAAESQWIVLDFIDVIVHIFHQDRRRFYALEDLWADAPRLDWQTGKVIERKSKIESEIAMSSSAED